MGFTQFDPIASQVNRRLTERLVMKRWRFDVPSTPIQPPIWASAGCSTRLWQWPKCPTVLFPHPDGRVMSHIESTKMNSKITALSSAGHETPSVNSAILAFSASNQLVCLFDYFLSYSFPILDALFSIIQRKIDPSVSPPLSLSFRRRIFYYIVVSVVAGTFRRAFGAVQLLR